MNFDKFPFQLQEGMRLIGSDGHEYVLTRHHDDLGDWCAYGMGYEAWLGVLPRHFEPDVTSFHFTAAYAAPAIYKRGLRGERNSCVWKRPDPAIQREMEEAQKAHDEACRTVRLAEERLQRAKAAVANNS